MNVSSKLTPKQATRFKAIKKELVDLKLIKATNADVVRWLIDNVELYDSRTKRLLDAELPDKLAKAARKAGGVESPQEPLPKTCLPAWEPDQAELDRLYLGPEQNPSPAISWAMTGFLGLIGAAGVCVGYLIG